MGVGVKTTPDGAVLAGWGRRLGGYLIDAVITGIIGVLLSIPWIAQVVDVYRRVFDEAMQAGQSGQPYTPPDATTLAEQILPALVPIVLISLAVFVLYHGGFLLWKGATPGKLLLGMRVRRRDRPGRLDVLTVLRRLALPFVLSLVNFVPLVSYLTSIVGLLDYLWPLWDEKNQALHDKLAGTNVVMAPRDNR